MDRQKLTAAERLWLEVFGPRGLPELDEGKVRAIVDGLPERQRMVVRLHFGFGGRRPLSFRAIGRKLSLSRETVRLDFKQAKRYLRHPSRRRLWEEARR
jgi:DNA-directed RNA polymerase sigma subunit (sigma70/sigma32)